MFKALSYLVELIVRLEIPNDSDWHKREIREEEIKFNLERLITK